MVPPKGQPSCLEMQGSKSLPVLQGSSTRLFMVERVAVMNNWANEIVRSMCQGVTCLEPVPSGTSMI